MKFKKVYLIFNNIFLKNRNAIIKDGIYSTIKTVHVDLLFLMGNGSLLFEWTLTY